MASIAVCSVVVFALAFELQNVEMRTDSENLVILAKRANDWYELLQLPEFASWQFLFAAACLVILIWSIVRVISRVNEDVDPAVSDQEMLVSISELRRVGDLTEDEYRSIKSQLVGRLRTTFQDLPKEHPVDGKAESPTASHSEVHSQKPLGESDKQQGSKSEESESMQSTTSSSLTEVPTPHQDTTDKTTKSVAPETETGEGN